MAEGSGMELVFNHSQRQIAAQNRGWQGSPLRTVTNAEVLRNIQTSDSTDSTAEDTYKEMRETLVKEGYIYVNIHGPSKSGKGGYQMGFARLLRFDVYYKKLAKENGFDTTDILPVPYAHCAAAAKFLGLVDPKSDASNYTPEARKRIAALQLELAQKALPEGESGAEISMRLRQQKRAVAILKEDSTPMTFPISLYPIELEGRDTGQSGLTSLALNPKSRHNIWIISILANEQLKEDTDSNDFRANVASSEDPAKTFGGSTRVLIPTSDGKEINAADLRPDLQNQLINLLRISSAPRTAVPILHEQMNSFLRELVGRGSIYSPTLLDYYINWRDILEARGLPKGRFRIVDNKWFPGIKHYDAWYLLNSLVLKQYPGMTEHYGFADLLRFTHPNP